MVSTDRFSKLVIVFILTGSLMAPLSGQAETLYALERDGADFRVIDRLTGADLDTISTSVGGSWRGMAMDPISGTLYATDTERLYTLDPATGASTLLGLFGSVLMRDLTFDSDGLLYGVTGNSGSDQHSLHLIDPDLGSAGFLLVLGGNRGHAIACDPEEPGLLYHLAQGVFETVDLSTLVVTPVGLSGDPIVGRSLGMVFDPIDRVLRLFDNGGRYYLVQLDGQVTQVGQNPTRYFGLAFDQRTTRVVLFQDGFEDGTTDAWSQVVP